MLTPLQAGMRSASYKLNFIITLLQIGWRKDNNVLKRTFKLWKCKQIYSAAVVQAGKSYGGGLEMSVIKCSDFFSKTYTYNFTVCSKESQFTVAAIGVQFIFRNTVGTVLARIAFARRLEIK